MVSIKEREIPLDDGRYFCYWSQKDFESLVASLGFDVVERSLEEGPRVTWLTLVMRVAPEG